MYRSQSFPVNKTLHDFYHSQSSNDSFYHDHPKKLHRQLYFKPFDDIINSIKDRFNQTDYEIHLHLQDILIKAFKKQDWSDDLQIFIQNHVVNELDVLSLKSQLVFLPKTATFYGLDSRMKLLETIALFKKLDTIIRMSVAEVIKLVKLILIMPATNDVSKRSFSFLKRIKIYLHSTAAYNTIS